MPPFVGTIRKMYLTYPQDSPLVVKWKQEMNPFMILKEILIL